MVLATIAFKGPIKIMTAKPAKMLNGMSSFVPVEKVKQNVDAFEVAKSVLHFCAMLISKFH